MASQKEKKYRLHYRLVTTHENNSKSHDSRIHVFEARDDGDACEKVRVFKKENQPCGWGDDDPVELIVDRLVSIDREEVTFTVLITT